MKDIDFDELDRAVSSVLTSNDSKAESVSVTPTPATRVSQPAPISAPMATPPVSVAPRPVITTSPAVRRSGGRFMDVVHPSSDMKTAPSTPMNRPRVSPISSDFAAPKPAPVAEPIVSAPQSIASVETDDTHPTLDTIDTPTTYEQPIQSPAPVQTWPDPLSVENPEPSYEDEAPLELQDDQAPVEQEPYEAPQTPFLTDAKVDKRPLGGFTPHDEELSTTTTFDDEELDSGSTPSMVPRELETDVVSLDANEVAPERVSPTAVAPQPVRSAAPAPQQVAAAPVSTSIPQQYKSTAPVTDNETHAVFDTDAYHQPLLPSKTGGRRVWIWVLLIVGLLAVGAGLGALSFMAGF